MKNKETKPKVMTKEPEIQIPFWAKIIFIPLIVGLVLVSTNISALFNKIGSALLIFGSLALLIYFAKFCKNNQEKIQKGKEDLFNLFKKKKVEEIKGLQELELEIDSMQKMKEKNCLSKSGLKILEEKKKELLNMRKEKEE